MSEHLDQFKLTFNKPAEKSFFEGEDVAGLEVKLENDTVFFRASSDQDQAGLLPIERRTRGGYESVISADLATNLLASLKMAGASIRLPFFLLVRDKGGWIKTIHYSVEGAPPKFEAHVRVWTPRERNEGVIPTELSERTLELLGEFAQVVFRAQSIVKQHAAARKVGRPPSEVRDADDVLDEFEKFVQMVLPGRVSRQVDDIQKIQTIRDLANSVLTAHSARSSELQNEISEVELRQPQHVRQQTVLDEADEEDVEITHVVPLSPPIENNESRWHPNTPSVSPPSVEECPVEVVRYPEGMKSTSMLAPTGKKRGRKSNAEKAAIAAAIEADRLRQLSEIEVSGVEEEDDDQTVSKEAEQETVAEFVTDNIDRLVQSAPMTAFTTEKASTDEEDEHVLPQVYVKPISDPVVAPIDSDDFIIHDDDAPLLEEAVAELESTVFQNEQPPAFADEPEPYTGRMGLSDFRPVPKSSISRPGLLRKKLGTGRSWK